MANEKKKKFPLIIVIIIVGMILLCCCPAMCLGVPVVSNMLNGYSPDPTFSEVIQEQPSGIEIASEEVFSPQDSQAFMEEIVSDAEFQPLYEWAVMEGYLEPGNEAGGGARVAYSDGSILRGVVHGGIQILQISSPSQPADGYVLSRYEGTDESPIWILFNQDGYAAIDESGISVFDQAGNTIGDAPFSAQEDGVQLASLSPPAATKCTTGGWDEFLRCIESQGSKLALGSACLITLAAGKVACVVGGAFTLGGSCIVAIAGVTVACGIVPGVCLKPALHDDLPEASISMWSDSGEKKWVSGGLAPGADSGSVGWIYATLWKAKLNVTDDREPAPSVAPPEEWISAGAGECVMPRIEDCGGNIIEPRFCAPDPSAAEQNTWQAHHPDFPPVESDLPQEEPTEQDIAGLPIEISYAGRYTGVMSNVVGSGGYSCSSKDEHWSDVVFTYRFNADDSVTRVGVVVEGEARSGDNIRVTYVPGDAGSYVNSNTTDNGFWQETLYFSNTELRIERYHVDNAAISGTCTVTLQVVPEP